MKNFFAIIFVLSLLSVIIPAARADLFDDLLGNQRASTGKYPEKQVSADRKVAPSKSVEKLFKAYFKYASKDDFEGMYLLMSPAFREKYGFGKFEYFMEKDLKVSGGLKGWTGLKKIRDNGRYSSWQIKLEYNNSRMAARTVVVEVVMKGGVYYFNNGMLMPLAALNK